MSTLIGLMSSELHIHSYSLLVLLGIAFLLGLSLFAWQSNTECLLSRRILAFMLASIALMALSFVLRREVGPAADWSYFLTSVQMAYGPLFYFYTRTLTDRNFVWQRKNWWHFVAVPASALLWWLQWSFSTSPGLSLPCLLEGGCTLVYMHRLPHIVAAWVSLVCYALLVLRLLQPYEQKIKSSYSAIEDINLRWVKALSWALLVLTFLAILFELGRYLGFSSVITGGHMQALALFVVSFLMVRYGMQQMSIQHEDLNLQAVSSAEVAFAEVQQLMQDGKKYQTSSLTKQQATELWKQLLHLMAEHMPHRQPGLKISELAELMQVPVHHLSETINGHAGQSFYDFINHYRLEEAARLLADPLQSWSVTDIGFQAGFNSTSTFYSQFKKRFGQTPKRFRQTTVQEQGNG